MSRRAISYLRSVFQSKKLVGNDRFEGFSIDFMDAIAKDLQFNVTYKLVSDGQVC